MTPKSVTITNLKPGCEAPRNHPWESHFALVGPNRVQTIGYKPIPGSCDSAQGPPRYNSFKTGTPLSQFLDFCCKILDLNHTRGYLLLFGDTNTDIHINRSMDTQPPKPWHWWPGPGFFLVFYFISYHKYIPLYNPCWGSKLHRSMRGAPIFNSSLWRGNPEESSIHM